MRLLMSLTALSALAALTACATADTVVECTPGVDADSDGISDCDEINVHGTDPNAADSDGDGLTDLQELDCVSDPTDANEQCYACGWEHNDPGNLSSNGAELGDTIRNLPLVDQCGDSVDLYDMAGEYRIAFMTAEWCNACLGEARHLDESADALTESAGFPVSYMIWLFEDIQGNAPNGEIAASYAEAVGDPDYPVFSDTSQGSFLDTPYDGRKLPGKCALSPSMEIIACASGEGAEPGLLEAIVAHASK